jgi:acyl-CoA dehydrogenase
MYDFGMSDVQRSLVEATRSFVERELAPCVEEVERDGAARPELVAQIRRKAIEAGLYAANMREDVGGAGLDNVTLVLVEKELGKTSYALQYTGVARPSNILLAGTPEQRERYLLPVVRGERVECLAMTEPEAGSDVRAIRTRAEKDGDGWRIRGTKHFISHADESDFVILLSRTGTDESGRGPM